MSSTSAIQSPLVSTATLQGTAGSTDATVAPSVGQAPAHAILNSDSFERAPQPAPTIAAVGTAASPQRDVATWSTSRVQGKVTGTRGPLASRDRELAPEREGMLRITGLAAGSDKLSVNVSVTEPGVHIEDQRFEGSEFGPFDRGALVDAQGKLRRGVRLEAGGLVNPQTLRYRNGVLTLTKYRPLATHMFGGIQKADKIVLKIRVRDDALTNIGSCRLFRGRYFAPWRNTDDGLKLMGPILGITSTETKATLSDLRPA